MNNNIVGFSKVGHWFWSAILLYFAFLMGQITIQYIPTRLDVAFLRIKQDVIGLTYYRIAFFSHVYSSVFVLIAGIPQYSPYLRLKFSPYHRYLGAFYCIVVIFISGPSGFIMGYHANGGTVSQISFCLLAVLWIVFTLKGWEQARLRNFIAHRKWMNRSYALTLSAISLRLWHYVFVHLFHPKPMDLYRVVAWLGWTLNLLIAEMIFRYWLSPKLGRPATKLGPSRLTQRVII